jgi:hypothetical protein
MVWMSILKGCQLTTKIIFGLNKRIADNTDLEKPISEDESKESGLSTDSNVTDPENGNQKGTDGNITVDFTTLGEKNEFLLTEFLPKVDFKG